MKLAPSARKDDDMLAAFRAAMMQGMVPQLATLEDEVLRELIKMMTDVAAACDRELAQRKLASAEVAGRA